LGPGAPWPLLVALCACVALAACEPWAPVDARAHGRAVSVEPTQPSTPTVVTPTPDTPEATARAPEGTAPGAASLAREGSTGISKGPPRKGCTPKKAKVVSNPVAPDSEYPVEARRRGIIDGQVIAQLSVDESGRVTQVKVVRKGGYGFDELAQKYMKTWHFKPAEKNCAKTASTVRFTYNFTSN